MAVAVSDDDVEALFGLLDRDVVGDRSDVRQILEEFGLGDDRIESVVGRADTDPFFPNDPYLSANQRVSILLVYEKPPVPVDLTP